MSSTTTDKSTFADLGLRAELLDALVALGHETPTPIQRAAIPHLLGGRDVVGQAATGTGKTGAFALPILERLAATKRSAPGALVLVPTRELAMQVAGAFEEYGAKLELEVLAIYGGQPIASQLRALRRGVDVVVATPGRALDHVRRNSLALASVEVLVLDEADEMLDLGFADDLEALLAETSAGRQTVLFSATLPPRIDAIARRHLRDPVRVRVEREVLAADAPRVEQRAYLVRREHKEAALVRLLEIEAPGAALVFCHTRDEVDRLAESLNRTGRRAEALHGGLSQEQRDRVLARVRSGATHLLVATDVAARGLDLEHLTHVVNLDVPSSSESYVHRVGRIGRAGRAGIAITLVEPRQERFVAQLERAVGQPIVVSPLPTGDELRARRVERLADELRRSPRAETLERYRPVLERLGDLDPLTVALAALALAAPAIAEDEAEIPVPDRNDARARRSSSFSGEERRPGGAAGRRATPGREANATRGPRRAANGATTRLYVGMGKDAGVRPQDLVGAITGETDLRGKDVGAIEIASRFSLVEVPAAAAEAVIAALRQTTLKGRRTTVRRERSDPAGTPAPRRPGR